MFFIISASAVLVIAVVFLVNNYLLDNKIMGALGLVKGPTAEVTKESGIGNKPVPEVSVTKDKDGYGLQIMTRGYTHVKSVEILVGYSYKGKENPSMVASGVPQQDSYWAHFRFESCSRGDCVRYKVKEARFSLTLNYEDGESRDFTSIISLDSVTDNTLISLNPSI
jgi:hypothetical protein